VISDLAGAIWKKGSRSNGSGGNNCVEVAFLDDGTTLVRDSNGGAGSSVLAFTLGEWRAFVGSTKDGEFDR
jgi:hypothetical protein